MCHCPHKPFSHKTAIILAGGKSSRMGRDKALLPWRDGKPIISAIVSQLQGFSEILVSTNNPSEYAFLGLPLVPDAVPEMGPLMGLISALKAASYEGCFVTTCDAPYLSGALMKSLFAVLTAEWDAVVPRHSRDIIEPLHAVYSRTALSACETTLQTNVQGVRHALGRMRVKYLDVDDFSWYRNMNYQREFLEAVAADKFRLPPTRIEVR